MIELYHGSISIFDEIDLTKCKPYRDFGIGFYTTEDVAQAENFARLLKFKSESKLLKSLQLKSKNKKVTLPKSESKTPYVYNLELDKSYLEDNNLNIKIFDKADKEWLLFVFENRINKNNEYKFDMVIGPTADADTLNIINKYKKTYLKRKLSDEVICNIIEELQPTRLKTQYVFNTEKSLKYLKFKNIKRRLIYA